MQRTWIASLVTCAVACANARAQWSAEPMYIAVQGDWCAASADGTVVIGQRYPIPYNVASAWTPQTGVFDLAPPMILAGDGRATDISWNGDVIVGSYTFAPTDEPRGVGVRWNGLQSPADFVALPGALLSLWTVSGAGSLQGGQIARNGGLTAFLWNGTSPPSEVSCGAGVNTLMSCSSFDGSVTFGRIGSRPAVWSEELGECTLLDGFENPGGINDCSSDGHVAVGWRLTALGTMTQAVIWTPTGTVALPPRPDRPWMEATGVSADGRIVVGRHNYGAPFTGSSAFIWDAHNGTRDLGRVIAAQLNRTPIRTGFALGISPDGRTVVGSGFILRLQAPCAADVDDGTLSGGRDGAVTLDDLSAFLRWFEAGSRLADIDDGSGRGVPDAMIDIQDLLFFLNGFEQGC